jgi:hypothetical protein
MYSLCDTRARRASLVSGEREMSDNEIMTEAEREIFDKLLVVRYEEVMHEHQRARRALYLAQCDEKDAEDEVRLLEWKQRLVKFAAERAKL